MPIEIHFLRPWWFLALVALIPLLLLLWRRRGGVTPWSKVVDAHLLPYLLSEGTGGARGLPILLLALGWLLAVMALAGPVWQRLPQPVFSLADKHVFVIDLSPSMDATDVTPSRLARARFELLDLLRATDEGESALVAIGPEPFLVSPLSRDARTIAAQVPNLRTDLIPVPGPKRVDLALQMAENLLERPGGAPGDVILISDGIGQGVARGSAVAAARQLAEAGHRVSVLVVGTPEGAPVLRKGGGFVSDADGAINISRLDASGLRDLAAAGDGRYVALDVTGADTEALLATTGLRPVGEEAAQSGLEADQWREEGPWLLLFVAPLAALAFRRGWLLPVLFIVALAPSRDGYAIGWDDLWQRPDQQGATAFERGEHDLASARFEDPAWRAAARYHVGDYAGALEDLGNLQGPEAAYNRGNALARLGQLEPAVAAYEETLEQVPEHADARANLELLQRLLEQQQQEDQKNQQGQQGQQGDQSQSESGQSGNAQGSDQQQDEGQSESGPGGQDQSDGSQRDDGSQAEDGSEGGSNNDNGEGSEQQPGPQDAADQSGENQQAAKSQAQYGQDRADGDSPRPGAEPDAGDLARYQARPDEGRRATAGAEPNDAEEGEQPPGVVADDAQGEAEEAKQASGLAAAADRTPQERERLQAVEAQLNRVPDDPSGLLRQRFILQHLRRSGRLQ